MTASIDLQLGALDLQIAPDAGGSIARFCIAGRDVLRRAAQSEGSAAAALSMSSFPMLPYANRIRNGCFEWQEDTFHIPANIRTSALPIHGVGWLRPWHPLGRVSTTRAQICLDHLPDESWPFAFTAVQTFALHPDGLSVHLDLHNPGPHAMPATLGFHPFFPEKPRLQTITKGLWETDQHCLPLRQIGPAPLNKQLARGAALNDLDVDNTLTGWSRLATLGWPGLSVELSASSLLSCLHLFTPPAEPFVCVEPVSGPADGLNPSHRPVVLAPDQRVSVEMRIAPRLI